MRLTSGGSIIFAALTEVVLIEDLLGLAHVGGHAAADFQGRSDVSEVDLVAQLREGCPFADCDGLIRMDRRVRGTGSNSLDS